MRLPTMLVGVTVVLAMAVPVAVGAQDTRSDVQVWSQSCSNCHTNQPARRYTGDQWSSIIPHMKIMARLTDGEAEAVLRYLKRGARKPEEGGTGGATDSSTTEQVRNYFRSGEEEPAREGMPVPAVVVVAGPATIQAPGGPFVGAEAPGARIGARWDVGSWLRTQAAPDGPALFEKECASCHGKQGRGNGRAGRDMDPRPTDIADPEFLSSRTDEQLLEVMANGKGEMVGLGADYGLDEMKAILAYVRKLGEGRKK